MSPWSFMVLLGTQLLTSARGSQGGCPRGGCPRGGCPQGECAQGGDVGSSLLSRGLSISRMALNTSEAEQPKAWWKEFIKNWVNNNTDKQFTCQVTPVEVTAPGTEADSSDFKEGVEKGLGTGATLMNAAAALALTGTTALSFSTGVGGVVASTALSVITPYLFPDPAPPPPSPKDLVNEAKTEIYTQMNLKVAELQACVNAAVGNTITLGGQLSHDLATMSQALGLAASVRHSLIQLNNLNDAEHIQSKAILIDKGCNTDIHTFHRIYLSKRIVIPYLTATMRMCFGFYVGWALAEFKLIQEGQSSETKYRDVMTMMVSSMNTFEAWFRDVDGDDAQVSEYKRSMRQTRVLAGLLKECQSRGSSCKWYEPQTFNKEYDSISFYEEEIKNYASNVKHERWREAKAHDAELRCFQCREVREGVTYVPGGPDKFFQYTFWYDLHSHPDVYAKWIDNRPEFRPIAPVYICGYDKPRYYRIWPSYMWRGNVLHKSKEAMMKRNEVFENASASCGDDAVPWLYWRTQEEFSFTSLAQKAAERKADRASRKAKIAAMPSGCQAFATTCMKGQPGHSSAQPWMASWNDLNTGITLCCMAGHHSEIFCSKLADELLSRHEEGPNVTLTDPLCNELEGLTNIQENWEEQPSALVQEDSREARLARMSHYLAKVHHKAGALMQYLGGAALASSLSLLAGTSTSGALVSALTGALVSNFQSCCEEGCETLTVPESGVCACWLKGGGWKEDTYVGR